MPIQSLDHVNLRTARLQEMIDWYAQVLDMPPGKRPDFGFPGAWLYANGQAMVHLVGISRELKALEPKLEHFAFGARDMQAFIARLNDHGVAHSIDPVPGFPVVQVNLHDPDGNHIHVDFDTGEAEGLS